jgi:hypothetical protein
MACCGARRNADLISVQFQVGLETVLGFQQAAIVISNDRGVLHAAE